jgi:hypothetical protein
MYLSLLLKDLAKALKYSLHHLIKYFNHTHNAKGYAITQMMLNEERDKPRREAAKAIIEELYYSIINDGAISLTFEQKIDSEIKKLLLLCHDQGNYNI